MKYTAKIHLQVNYVVLTILNFIRPVLTTKKVLTEEVKPVKAIRLILINLAPL